VVFVEGPLFISNGVVRWAHIILATTYRMRLLSWMHSVKANAGVRVENARFGKPPFGQSLHAHPVQAMSLAATYQSFPPQLGDPKTEDMQTVCISRYRVVVEVALHDRLEPLSGFHNWIVRAV
jgi:hypothetical protein